MNLTLLANTQSRVLGHACRHGIAYPLEDIVTKSMGRVLVPGSSKILVWYENGLLLMYSRRRELMEGEGGKVSGRSWKRRKVEPKLRKAKFGRLPSLPSKTPLLTRCKNAVGKGTVGGTVRTMDEQSQATFL